MEDLIASLIGEHRLIRQILDDLFRAALDEFADAEKIQKLERLILNHIEREDSEIYIPFKKLLKLPPQATELIESSRHRIKDAKILAIIFFEKYKGEKNEYLRKKFSEDLVRLAEKLKERILFEEQQLFPFLKNFWDAEKGGERHG